jgi:hypothetical protein
MSNFLHFFTYFTLLPLFGTKSRTAGPYTPKAKNGN